MEIMYGDFPAEIHGDIDGVTLQRPSLGPGVIGKAATLGSEEYIHYSYAE